MGISCTPHGYHMHTHGYHTVWFTSHTEDLQEKTVLKMLSHEHHMGISCTPHEYHMHTTWVSHCLVYISHWGPARENGLNVISWTPYGHLMHTTWVSHAHHMGITLSGLHLTLRTCKRKRFKCYLMNTIWASHAHHMYISHWGPARENGFKNVISWTPYGHLMHTTWVSHAHYMGITLSGLHLTLRTCKRKWFKCYLMNTIWASHAHHMGITCTPHGYHTVWFTSHTEDLQEKMV